MELGEYFFDHVRGAAIEDTGIGTYTTGSDYVSVPLDMPLCVKEETGMDVTFENSGDVVLMVRSELGLKNDMVQSMLGAARTQVVGLLPEWLNISNFVAPSEGAYFGNPDREFHARLSVN